MNIAIVGGGIGGLTLALALHQHGIPCRVYESAPEVRELGVGITLLPHAMRELSALGLGEALARQGIENRESCFYNRFGQLIYAEPRGRAAGYPVPEVGIHRGGSRAVISVRDTGSGIPAADLDHIFDRFARADPGRSRHTGGSGLGLSIVKAIVDAHGGEVRVSSAVGVGTTFKILLPLSPVVPSPPGRTSTQARSGLATASTAAFGALETDARELDV